jgi:peroxiredoxin (alkyl hydroperoxide reductase subunit C)
MQKIRLAAILAVVSAALGGCATAPDGPKSPARAEAPSTDGPRTLVGGPAPPFTAEAVMPDGSFGTVNLDGLRGQRVLLFFYPADFTFVCPTEIIAFDEKLEEFAKRKCAVIGASVDSKFTHLAWKNTPRDKGGIGPIRYPLVADVSKQLSRRYGVLLGDDTVALRGLFLIDAAGTVRHALVNDLPIGRSIDEALRTLDAVIFVETHGDEVCPANWRAGEQTLTTSFDGIADYLSKQQKDK